MLNRAGLILQVGTSILKSDYLSEFLVGIGGFERKYSNNKYSSLFFGIGYERYWQSKTNSIKINSTFCTSSHLIFGTDLGLSIAEGNKKFFIQPELGLHFIGIQLTYDYKFISDKYFSLQKGHYVSLKYQFVLHGEKYFTPNY